MSEIRLDFLTKRPVIFTNIRENKPTDLWDRSIIKIFDKFEDIEYSSKCPFCIDNENMRPDSLYSDLGVKIIPNMYPIIKKETQIEKINKFCYFSTGTHDVIIESDLHNKTYFNMSVDNFFNIYSLMHKRYCELMKGTNTSYVSLFKNYKMLGGASLQHSHSQILSIDAVPIKLNHELNCAKDYYEKNTSCSFCDMINYELKENKRVIYKDENFVVLEPYASAYKYETHIYPKKHVSGFEDETNIKSLSNVIYTIFKMMYKNLGDFPFNMYLNSILKNKPNLNKSYHYSFRIIPKLSGSAGFEMSSGIRVNSLYPEDATKNILKNNN